MPLGFSGLPQCAYFPIEKTHHFDCETSHENDAPPDHAHRCLASLGRHCFRARTHWTVFSFHRSTWKPQDGHDVFRYPRTVTNIVGSPLQKIGGQSCCGESFWVPSVSAAKEMDLWSAHGVNEEIPTHIHLSQGWRHPAPSKPQGLGQELPLLSSHARAGNRHLKMGETSLFDECRQESLSKNVPNGFWRLDVQSHSVCIYR